jgi:uncharacterized protein (TIGR02757 family)
MVLLEKARPPTNDPQEMKGIPEKTKMARTNYSSYCLPCRLTKDSLDALYVRYNHREFIHPDPLEFLFHFDDPADREIVGIMASSLAYGRVAQILKSVSRVLERMGPYPSRFLRDVSFHGLLATFEDFKHRFTTGGQLAALLFGVKQAVARYGSLERCFLRNMSRGDANVLPALAAFVQELNGKSADLGSMFLPSPVGGSACKRLNLFLRWMVRQDDVDPGGWTGVSPAMLVVPLDTHMHRIGLTTGFMARKQADLKAVVEMTEAFKSIVPDDPVRYDFALTRLGIREGIDS